MSALNQKLWLKVVGWKVADQFNFLGWCAALKAIELLLLCPCQLHFRSWSLLGAPEWFCSLLRAQGGHFFLHDELALCFFQGLFAFFDLMQRFFQGPQGCVFLFYKILQQHKCHNRSTADIHHEKESLQQGRKVVIDTHIRFQKSGELKRLFFRRRTSKHHPIQ